MSEATDEMTSKIAKDSIEDSTVEGVRSLEADKYKYGFDSDIEQEFAPKGLNEDIVRFISEKKDEPQWLLDWRLEAYRRWLTLEEPEWAMVDYPKIDFQDMYYYATLNNAVFSDGSFVYIPPGVRCPMELSTYFRMNAQGTGQFERTLIIADKGSYVSYLEGCTAPMRDENQLHAAIVEIIVHDDAEVKYSTVQNWWPGDKDGNGGVYNFVTKRADCRGTNSKVSWTQVETGSAVTWKYPSCILRGDNSQGEFYSIAITNGHQQADTGTKMIHLGKNTKSRVISKGISAGKSNSTYRGLVSAHKKAVGARNFTQCDSLLIGDLCGAHTVPYIESNTPK